MAVKVNNLPFFNCIDLEKSEQKSIARGEMQIPPVRKSKMKEREN